MPRPAHRQIKRIARRASDERFDERLSEVTVAGLIALLRRNIGAGEDEIALSAR
jgi:hypothetical protein